MHRPGKKCKREEPHVSEEYAIDTEVMALQERSPQGIRKLQLDDPTIGPLWQAVEKDERLEQEIIKCLQRIRLVQLWDRLLVEEGLLKQKYGSVKGSRGLMDTAGSPSHCAGRDTACRLPRRPFGRGQESWKGS